MYNSTKGAWLKNDLPFHRAKVPRISTDSAKFLNLYLQTNLLILYHWVETVTERILWNVDKKRSSSALYTYKNGRDSKERSDSMEPLVPWTYRLNTPMSPKGMVSCPQPEKVLRIQNVPWNLWLSHLIDCKGWTVTKKQNYVQTTYMKFQISYRQEVYPSQTCINKGFLIKSIPPTARSKWMEY